MPTPTVRAVGTIASGTGTITPAHPSGALAGDLLLMVTETTGGESPTRSGWSHTPSSPQATGSGTTGTKCSVLWRIHDGSAAGATNDPGDHIAARVIGITRGTFNQLSPFNTSNGGVDAAGTTAVSIPGVTTTLPNCLLVAAVTGDLPDPSTQGTAEFSGWTGTYAMTERIDNTRNAGNGGALGAATGVATSAGATDVVTCTAATSAVRGKIMLAIAPSAVRDMVGGGVVPYFR